MENLDDVPRTSSKSGDSQKFRHIFDREKFTKQGVSR